MLIEIILMGCFATLFMDVAGRLLSRTKLLSAFMKVEEVGRWFLYSFKGRFIHQDIRKVPALKFEKATYYIMHYLIGIVLAGIFIFWIDRGSSLVFQMLTALTFGIITVVFPWFVLLPGSGFGFLASKSSDQFRIVRTNLIHHTNFGLGLSIWMGIRFLIS